jgi:hypothetical protein
MLKINSLMPFVPHDEPNVVRLDKIQGFEYVDRTRNIDGVLNISSQDTGRLW